MSLRCLLGRQHLLWIPLAVWATVGFAPAVGAHPHVWATVRSEIVLGPNHQITGIRHAWTFDEFYTAMAIEGLDASKDGVYSKEELKPLAQVSELRPEIRVRPELKALVSAAVSGSGSVTDAVQPLVSVPTKLTGFSVAKPKATKKDGS